jgi:hypothetical protein
VDRGIEGGAHDCIMINGSLRNGVTTGVSLVSDIPSGRRDVRFTPES